MDRALPNSLFLALNRGHYLTESCRLPQSGGVISIATHFENAKTDLLHFHDEPHLTMILNGGVIDKRQSLDVERFSGELMFFHAGESHQTINKLFPTKYITLQFFSDFFRINLLHETDLNKIVQKNLNVKFTMLKIYKELMLGDEFSASSVEMLVSGLTTTSTSNINKKGLPKWLNKIHQQLHEDWDKKISLNDLAATADVHPKTISRLFPKYFNCTLGEYRRQIKVLKALSLIKNSKLSLTEIAHECGFYDQSHFISNFKQLTGFLPKHFKKL